MFSQLTDRMTFGILFLAILVLGFIAMGVINALGERSKRNHEAHMKFLELEAKRGGRSISNAYQSETKEVDPITEVRIK